MSGCDTGNGWKGEGFVCVWMGVRPAELGEAEEVEVQYKTGSTECERP